MKEPRFANLVENSLLAFAVMLLPMAVAILAHSIAKIPKIGNSLVKVLCVTTFALANLSSIAFNEE